jgi:hypothetical protein
MACGSVERSSDNEEKTELYQRLKVGREQEQEETKQVTST